MHTEVFTVATTGGVGDSGLLAMAGGGWESCEVTEFPAQVDLTLVGVIVHAPEDTRRSHVINVSVAGSDGQTGGLGSIRIEPSTPSSVVKTPFAYPISLTVNGPVVLALTATVEDGPTFGPTEFAVRARQ